MTVPELIGMVVALHLKGELADDRGGEGTARFTIDSLSAEQTAAVARAILGDPVLQAQVELKLPRRFLDGLGLPAEVLTDLPATYFRNATAERPVLVIANTGDDEEQSLKEFSRIGAAEVQEHPGLWVKIAGEGLLLSDLHAKWWEKALAALQEMRAVSLERLGGYVLATRETVKTDGLPILSALGASLPALRLPKDTGFSNRVRENARGHVSAWKREFTAVFRNRACYLLKQTPNQLLLSDDDLRAAFDKVKDVVPVGLHGVVTDFIAAANGWNTAAEALARCEWEQVKPLFDGVRRERFNLAKETVRFYEDREPELLSQDDATYLKSLTERSASEPNEDDAAFYDSHRNELKEDRKLKSAWDRFVFGKPREVDDFILGIGLAMESLFSQGDAGTKRRLRVRCDRATKKELKDLNVDAGLYFARRYAGLKAVFGDRVSWDVGQLFDFPKVVADWESRKVPLNRSTSRASLQLKFVVELEVEASAGKAGTQSFTTQLVWRFDLNGVASQFYDDWSRLAEHPLVVCKAVREDMSSKGRLQSVDLSNVKTLRPAYDRDRGSFVSAYRKVNDLGLLFRKNLADARQQHLLATDVADEIEQRFGAFESAYGTAIRDLSAVGLSSPAVRDQAAAYGDLLDCILRRARGDRNRELLLRPLLLIGAAQIEGGPAAVVVTPWHPLRLAAVQQKAKRIAALVRHLLTSSEVFFGDTRLFFKDLAQELSHPFYPEIVLGWQGSQPELLTLSDTVQDYSLHESPVHKDVADDTNENPANGSACVMDLVQRYLSLHPHEHANMSVVLFNCDSARLPQAVVDKIGQLYEDEDDVRCQVLLRHSDPSRLGDLYRAIVSLEDADPDSFNASEATQDFMARLRICIIADQAPPPDPKDGCPYDIVFSQDVIARHSQIEWYPETATPAPLDTLVPARWSRRRPAARDDMKSAVYLCCPVQSREGWAFVSAVTTFLKGDWNGDESQRLLPVRQLDFRDNRTARIFEETHNLGNWVVNYDELLDRRQLLNQQVRVIRYKQSSTQGRNVVISSKAPLGLLQSMVLVRLKALNLGLSEDEYSALAGRFIADANDVSGDIVLRAAKRGRSASELIGIVLSRFMLRRELGEHRFHGWYFLDDYADWLGQREEQIADILALAPDQSEEGRLRLTVYLSEAKYIEAASLAAKRKESQKQLRDTVKRINEAVFGAPERLDRGLWLARLSDLILDGVQVPASAGINLSDWRRAVREGECDIAVRGYSHVFVWGPDDGTDSSFAPVTDLDASYQEVFGRVDLRELVLCYFRGQDPMPVRRRNAGRDVWGKLNYRRPTDPTPEKPKRKSRGGGEDEPPTSDGFGGGPPDPLPQRPSPPSSRTTPRHEAADKPAGVDSRTSGWAYPAIEEVVAGVQVVAEDDADREWLRSVETGTRHALQQFHLQAKLLSTGLTPNCALLKFAGSANLTVEQVNRRRSELLTTYGLNVVAVRPEPGVISLAIERPKRRVIRAEEVWSKWEPRGGWGNRSLLIGVRESDGELLTLSPGSQHAPHTLIAGSTGSGKSVLMQNIILGIAATNTPAQARILLVDPKHGVDYFAFEDLPHLDGPLVVEPVDATAKLEQLVAEMNSRYAMFRSARSANLNDYNVKVPERERLPVVWVIHDEFAEWMMVQEYKDAVTSTVGRLGVKARAAGIHLVFAAQRPDANVMPMQLRANLGNRLILKVDSVGTSEIALGEPGAESLLGNGHLLAKLEGTPGLCYAQVPFVDPSFTERVAKITREG